MTHVIQRPRDPFRTADGRLEVHQIPAWTDNLIWLAVCTQTGAAAVIDGPEATPVLSYCDKHDIQLSAILNTHTHRDHVGINLDLAKRGKLAQLSVMGPGTRPNDVPGLTRGVHEGDTVQIGMATGTVLLTEGHIDGHVCYLFDDVLFCGDTMFGAGCGYLFDGPPAKMHHSLSRLAQLPPGTRVCCAHEYTEDNLRFAWMIEPDNLALKERIQRVWALRARGECSVPSTIGEERATNPFLRGDSDTLRRAVANAMPGSDISTPEATFTAVRALKDRKDHRALTEAALGLPTPTV
jgi:hydroxyacylglutathione hydrolase